MIDMDYLEIDGEVIRYNINPELMCCKYDKYGELIKAQRMILFFNSSGDAIGSGPYYDDIDKVTCITKQVVIEVYHKYVKKERNK